MSKTKKTTKKSKPEAKPTGRCQRIATKLHGHRGRVEKLTAAVEKLTAKLPKGEDKLVMQQAMKALNTATDKLAFASETLAEMPATLGASKRGKLVQGAKVAIKEHHQKRYEDLLSEKDMASFGLTIAKVNGSKFVLELKQGKDKVRVLANRGHLEVEA